MTSMDDMVTAMAMVGLNDLDQVLATSPGNSATSSAPTADLRRRPWTVDEDILLVNYIAAHGEGRWNSLARSAGLKRMGKSCRLRWLNYLRPDVKRGDFTADEQLLILDLHTRWGNRWSKIAQHLPGRTDNEIKNYWRTRVQKYARHLRCDVDSASFRHVLRHVWMPRLRERAQADRQDLQPVAAAAPVVQGAPSTITARAQNACYYCYGHHMLQQQGVHHSQYYREEPVAQMAAAAMVVSPDDASSALRPSLLMADDASHYTAAFTYTSVDMEAPTNDQGCRPTMTDDDVFAGGTTWSELLATASGPDDDFSSMSMIDVPDFGFGDFEDGLWSLDDLCLQQLC